MVVMFRPLKISLLSLLLGLSVTMTSCQRSAPSSTNNAPTAAPSVPNSASPNGSPTSTTPDPTPRPSPRTPLEATLNDIAVFDFIQVFVFTRLDGKPFDTADYDFLKANAPKETNQWAKSTDNLHAVAGTNFVFAQTQLDALRARFKVDDVTATYGRKR